MRPDQSGLAAEPPDYRVVGARIQANGRPPQPYPPTRQHGMKLMSAQAVKITDRLRISGVLSRSALVSTRQQDGAQ